MKLVSYNVNGLGDEKERKKIFNYVKKNSSGNSIIFLQETYTTAKIEKLYKYQWHGNMIFSHGTSNSRRVIVAFRHGLEYKMLSDPICDPNGRYIVLDMEIQGSPYILVNCYAPNNEQEQIKLFHVIRDHLKKLEPDEDVNIILEGDWNLIFNSSLDALGGKPGLKVTL